jgi:hypothetical protein
MAYVLGCPSAYHVGIHLQGGGVLWTQIDDGVTTVKWQRKRDDFSVASITVAKRDAGDGCCAKLGRTYSWAHELTLYRDDTLVWQGPIVRKTESRTTFGFEARDMIAWLDRRSVKPSGAEYFFPNAVDTGSLIRQLVTEGFTSHDPGLLAYAVLSNTGTNSTLDHTYYDSVAIGHVVRDLIKAGVDIYTVGRALHVVADDPVGRPLMLSEADFLSELTVAEAGLDACTRGVVVGGQPVDGSGQSVQGPPVIGSYGGPVAGFGLIEQVSPSQTTINAGVASGIAAKMVSYGTPPPVDIIVPDGAQLSPSAPVDINQLIPAATLGISLSSFCTPVASQQFRLSEVDVTWSSGSEQVAVSLAAGGPAVTYQDAS